VRGVLRSVIGQSISRLTLEHRQTLLKFGGWFVRKVKAFRADLKQWRSKSSFYLQTERNVMVLARELQALVVYCGPGTHRRQIGPGRRERD
jgi:hypothetical protein